MEWFTAIVGVPGGAKSPLIYVTVPLLSLYEAAEVAGKGGAGGGGGGGWWGGGGGGGGGQGGGGGEG